MTVDTVTGYTFGAGYTFVAHCIFIYLNIYIYIYRTYIYCMIQPISSLKVKLFLHTLCFFSFLNENFLV